MANVPDALWARLVGQTTVTDLVGTSPKRIYKQVIPQNSAMPCVCLREIDDVPDNHLTGASGSASARYEVASVATTPEGAIALRAVVRAALDRYRGTSNSLVIRDCVRTSGGIDELPPNESSDNWRYVATDEYEIGYQPS